MRSGQCLALGIVSQCQQWGWYVGDHDGSDNGDCVGGDGGDAAFALDSSQCGL